jgi:hypothetical protein
MSPIHGPSGNERLSPSTKSITQCVDYIEMASKGRSLSHVGNNYHLPLTSKRVDV